MGVICQAAYIIHHEGSDSPANLIIGLGFAVRTQQDEEKPVRVTGHLQQMKETTKLTRDRRTAAPRRHRDLGQASQRRGLSQAHKRDERLFQEIHLTDQNVGGFCVTRDLLHEFVFQLGERRWDSEKGSVSRSGGPLVDGSKASLLPRTEATLPSPYQGSTWQESAGCLI